MVELVLAIGFGAGCAYDMDGYQTEDPPPEGKGVSASSTTDGGTGDGASGDARDATPSSHDSAAADTRATDTGSVDDKEKGKGKGHDEEGP